MINIPEQLQSNKIRFIKINRENKKPIEKDWCETGNYRYTESEFKNYLKTAKSYGVACGFNDLVIVDIENQEDMSVANLWAQGKFPQTFTVKTGGGGWHLYYHTKDISNRIRLIKDGKHYGEIQTKGNQCLGPGSMHPSGTKYTVLNPAPIAIITKKELLKILKGFTQEKDPSKFAINSVSSLNWDISELIKHCPGLKTKDDIKWRGSHPTHGSENGQNFEIDIEKNTWYCFRCEVGGDAINLIAMLERLVDATGDCSTKGKFREVFVGAKKIGIKKYGFPDDGYKAPRKTEDTKICPDLFVYGDKGGIRGKNIEKVAAWFIAHHPTVTIESVTGKGTHIYVYKDGYYRINGQSIIRTFIQKQFKKQDKELWSYGYENAMINYIMTFSIKTREDFNTPKNLINCNNKIYDLNNLSKTHRHHSKYNFLYKLPWNYSEKSKELTQELRDYFESTFNGNEKIICLAQELFGYCLYSDYPYPGLFYLYGTGGNGKKVFITLLEKLLGEDNIASESINSLITRRFSTAQLYGKLLNSCGELSGKTLQESDLLKNLTGGDRITAEFKGLDNFSFLNIAKIVTACNSIPNIYDTSYGWYDRQIIIPFIQKFRYTEKEDTKLIEKLTTPKNMESLLYWAIQGLHRLLKNNGFSYSSEHEKIYKMYQGNTKYFVNSFYCRSDNLRDYIRVDDVRAEYKKWCKENSIPLDSEDALGKAFRYFGLPPAKYISEGNKKIYARHGMKKVDI